MAEYSGGMAVPGGVIGSGEAQVYNMGGTLNILHQQQARDDAMEKSRLFAKLKSEQIAAHAKREDKPASFEGMGTESFFVEDLKNRVGTEIKNGTSSMSRAKDPYEKSFIAQNTSNNIRALNATAANQVKIGKERQIALEKEGYRFNLDEVIRDFGGTNPDALNINNGQLLGQLESHVKANPRYFNTSFVGKEAIERAGKRIDKVTDYSGRTVEQTMPSYVLPRKNAYDQIIIDEDKALGAILGTPSGGQQIPILANQLLRKEGVDTRFLFKPEVEWTQAEKGMYLNAARQTVKKYIPEEYVDAQFVRNSETNEGVASQKAVGNKLAEISKSRQSAKGATYYTDQHGRERFSNIDYGGNVETFSLPKKDVAQGANKKFYFKSSAPKADVETENTEVIDPVTKFKKTVSRSAPNMEQQKTIDRAFTKNSDGSYTMNVGFGVSGGQVVNTHILTKPTKIKIDNEGGKEVLKPVGTEVGRDQLWQIPRENYKSGEFYKLSPQAPQLKGSEDEAAFWASPKAAQMEILIPVDEMGELSTAINRTPSGPSWVPKKSTKPITVPKGWK